MSTRYRYLEWVIASYPRARFNLANSAVAVPPPDVLGEVFAGPAALAPGVLDGPARAAVASSFGVDPARVVLGQGASGTNYLVFAAHVRPGDVVAVEEPGYEPLIVVPEALGARVVRYPLHDAAALERALDAAGGRCALIVVTTPHNPSTRVLSENEGKAFAAVAARRGARLLVDEVYLDALVDPPPSAAALPRTTVTSSLTKSYGLGALRFGWAIAPDAAEADALRDQSAGTIGALATPLLALGIAALERRHAILAHARALLAEGHAAFAALAAAAGGRLVRVPSPAGVIVWAALPGVGDTRAFAERLLAERETLVSPGVFFGAPGFVRLGLGGEAALVREGLSRLGQALRAGA